MPMMMCGSGDVLVHPMRMGSFVSMCSPWIIRRGGGDREGSSAVASWECR